MRMQWNKNGRESWHGIVAPLSLEFSVRAKLMWGGDDVVAGSGSGSESLVLCDVLDAPVCLS